MVVSTSTSGTPLVVVLGATGAQGGSVIRHLQLSERPYRIRAITRDPNSKASQDLAALGAEVYPLEVTPEKERELTEAFKSADVVFAVTAVGPNSAKDGLVLAEAAKAAQVKLFVWSGLPSYAEVSKGEFTNVVHFEVKPPVVRALGSVPYVDVQPAGYFSNFVKSFNRPVKQDDGSFAVFLPLKGDTPIDWIDTTADYGAFVVAAIEKDNANRPKEVRAATELLSLDEAAKIMSEESGKTVRFQQLEPEVYRQRLASAGLPPLFQTAVSEMYEVIGKYGYYGEKRATPREELGIKANFTSFRDFAKQQDWNSVLA